MANLDNVDKESESLKATSIIAWVVSILAFIAGIKVYHTNHRLALGLLIGSVVMVLLGIAFRIASERIWNGRA